MDFFMDFFIVLAILLVAATLGSGLSGIENAIREATQPEEEKDGDS